jgi:hypothetical protein
VILRNKPLGISIKEAIKRYRKEMDQAAIEKEFSRTIGEERK